jgi:hypothetical protein
MNPRTENSRAQAEPVLCPTCGVTAAAAVGKKDGPVVHCTGARNVFRVLNRRPHHGTRLWHCPRCRRVVGCDTCAGARPEMICCIPCETFVDGDVLAGSGREPIAVRFTARSKSEFKAGIEASQPREAG